MQHSMTLCWDCANATGGCSWSDYWEHSPVPGWIAIPTKLKLNNETNGSSYAVISCPEFIRDAQDGGTRRLRKNDKNEDEI